MHVVKKCSPFAVAAFLWMALSASQARTQQPASESLLKPSETSSPAATIRRARAFRRYTQKQSQRNRPTTIAPLSRVGTGKLDLSGRRANRSFVNVFVSLILYQFGSCRTAFHRVRSMTVVVDNRRVGFLTTLSTGPVVRVLTAIILRLGLALLLASDSSADGGAACEGMIESGSFSLASHCDSGVCGALSCGCNPANGSSNQCMHEPDDLDWLDSVKVGYDNGFLIASRRELDLQAGRYPFRMKLNGWGQLRHTITDYSPPSRDLNEFQLKRGRIVFSGTRSRPISPILSSWMAAAAVATTCGCLTTT